MTADEMVKVDPTHLVPRSYMTPAERAAELEQLRAERDHLRVLVAEAYREDVGLTVWHEATADQDAALVAALSATDPDRDGWVPTPRTQRVQAEPCTACGRPFARCDDDATLGQPPCCPDCAETPGGLHGPEAPR